MNRPLRRRHLLALAAAGLPLSLLGLQACQRRAVPVAILTSLTGAAVDHGTTVRDGALLAFEMRTELERAGLPALKWLEFDDAQQPETLPDLAARIAASGAVAVLGPVTSNMAAHWIPLAQTKGLLTLSPTATSHDFSGLDDLFFRVVASTRTYGQAAANFAAQQRGWRRLALIRDDSNAPYTRSWTEFFSQQASAHGATVLPPLVFTRPADAGTKLALLHQALAQRPDALVLVANATDTAALAQLLRQVRSAASGGQGPELGLLACEWASTLQLIVRGGRSVEGMWVPQYFNRNSQEEAYLRFVQRLQLRFGRAPGFAEVAGFDAMYVLLQALAQQQSGEALKDTLLRVRRFRGIQDPINFDAYGDHDRRLFMSQVRDSSFHFLNA